MVPQPETHKERTQGSPAAKLLRSLIDQSEIEEDSDPKSIYESNPVFYANHRLDLFRTRLNTLRKQYADLKVRSFFSNIY